ERRVGEVRQVALAAELAHDLSYRRIVAVADAREEVVLDLVVEPADVPRDQRVLLREIGGRRELVLEERALELPLRTRRRAERRSVDRVRELEDGSERDA